MSIGARLKEERLRLGMSQTEFAALGGASKKSQIRYEANEGGGADCAFLHEVSKAGVDVAYVLTGTRRAVAAVDLGLLTICLAGVEEGLEATDREMSAEKKAELVAMLYELHRAAESPPQKATILQFIKRAA